MNVSRAPIARPAATAASSAGATSSAVLPMTSAIAAAPPAFFTTSPCRASNSMSFTGQSSRECGSSASGHPKDRLAARRLAGSPALWTSQGRSRGHGSPTAQQRLGGLARALERPPVTAVEPDELAVHPLRQPLAERNRDVRVVAAPDHQRRDRLALEV